MANAQPNIVFIITDHQAYYGHDRAGEYEYKWDNFERFAAEGVRFNRAYSVCPLCSPARSSMMTGVYPSSHGIIMNTEAELNSAIKPISIRVKVTIQPLLVAGGLSQRLRRQMALRPRAPAD